ncbi:hypothetical protein [Bradyrhizobium archetypum]|uniref:Uncharacterized protein n=1 Tax=Bradyrhizobium archetypum TaxID=2721160 RepID=A0A7Y4H5M2_9BRAD|nr:hypothetical protein [Bradyrhizobium archetypum]NOJ47828.1 hypothetical protein [Bradyrhizobium archetypum]
MLQLNPNGVAAPTHRAVVACREVVDFYFDALARADLSKKPPAPEGSFFRFDLTGNDLSTADRRALHENWILARAFQELVRGVRASLEEAYFFIELLAAGTMTAPSSGTLEEILAPFRKKAADLRFPPLLAHVNSRLDRPLEFSDAYRSMQAARNCLEHRDGIVGKSDAGPNGIMNLQFPALKGFFQRDGQGVEIYQGIAVDAGTEIEVRVVVRSREFKIGERLTITAADFDEIAFACFQFAAQLAKLLPKPAV